MRGTTHSTRWRSLVGSAAVCALAALGAVGATACGGASPAAADVGIAGLTLSALDGSKHEPIPEIDGALTVLVFSASDCPIANAYAPELRSLHADYTGRGVRFFLVNVEPSTPAAELADHAAQYELPRPILRDRDHALAARVGATVTPEAVVLSPGGAIAYRGRIDDRYPDLGVRRPAATKRELREALDALLQGRSVPVPRTESVGCWIEDWVE